jgi:excisionase family DNA binding protein
MADLLTIEEAAEALSLSPHTIRSWVKGRRIEFVRLGRSIRIRRTEVDRVLREGTVVPSGKSTSEAAISVVVN